MKLLLDECVTRYVKRDLVGHEVSTVDEAGLKGLKNGQLLQRAADDGFEVLITVDQNLSYQQNLRALPVAILVLVAYSNAYAKLKPLMPQALEKLQTISKGAVVRVEL
jgi:hypothetical protein